ncbi:MAG: DUF1778 domain-containing protein [Roseiarcus sp.]
MPRDAAAETNIHLRAHARDRDLIDQAAELVGANRSQFMLGSAIEKAKSILLDQTTLHLDAEAFQRVMDWMDSEPDPEAGARAQRLMATKAPWAE